MPTMGVVFDANVWVSNFAYPGGIPERCVRVAIEGMVRSITSEDLIDQVRRALLGPKLAPRVDPVAVARAELAMRAASLVVIPTVRLSVITAKESDNRVLECAVAGRADLIVTGDRKHLLGLRQHAGNAIVSPVDFLRTVPPAG